MFFKKMMMEVRSTMSSKNITQRDIARGLDISEITVSKVIRGKSGYLNTLLKVLHYVETCEINKECDWGIPNYNRK